MIYTQQFLRILSISFNLPFILLIALSFSHSSSIAFLIGSDAYCTFSRYFSLSALWRRARHSFVKMLTTIIVFFTFLFCQVSLAFITTTRTWEMRSMLSPSETKRVGLLVWAVRIMCRKISTACIRWWLDRDVSRFTFCLLGLPESPDSRPLASLSSIFVEPLSPTLTALFAFYPGSKYFRSGLIKLFDN